MEGGIFPDYKTDFFFLNFYPFFAGVGGVLRLRCPGRSCRTAHSHPETGEPAKRGRVVQLRLRERGRHVQNRNEIPDRRGVRQVRLRGRGDGQTADGRVRCVFQGLRTGGHRHHRPAASSGRRLQRPAQQGPPVPGRLRRRTVPRGPQRVLQVGTATVSPGRPRRQASPAATAVMVHRGHRPKGQIGQQAVPGPSVRAQFRPDVRFVFHLVLGMKKKKKKLRRTKNSIIL